MAGIVVALRRCRADLKRLRSEGHELSPPAIRRREAGQDHGLAFRQGRPRLSTHRRGGLIHHTDQERYACRRRFEPEGLAVRDGY